MKVYVAFSGVYEERHIVGVFTSRAPAVVALTDDPEWLKENNLREEANRRRMAVGAKYLPIVLDIEEHEVKD